MEQIPNKNILIKVKSVYDFTRIKVYSKFFTEYLNYDNFIYLQKEGLFSRNEIQMLKYIKAMYNTRHKGKGKIHYRWATHLNMFVFFRIPSFKGIAEYICDNWMSIEDGKIIEIDYQGTNLDYSHYGDPQD